VVWELGPATTAAATASPRHGPGCVGGMDEAGAGRTVPESSSTSDHFQIPPPHRPLPNTAGCARFHPSAAGRPSTVAAI
jgi:hypothetical protein